MTTTNPALDMQWYTEHARLVASQLEATQAAELVSAGNIRLVLFHRNYWWPAMQALGIDRPLGTPDDVWDEWWAIVGYGGRGDYRLVPLGSDGPSKWILHRQDEYVITSQKSDLTCSYHVTGLLDALLVRGEHYHWSLPPRLADIRPA